jgi:glyoxylase-like metal-dependent hydrolase (beta-lactamase superfamily II)
MAPEPTAHHVEELARDIARLRVAFVNVYFVGMPGPRAAGDATPWVLVDAALSIGTGEIMRAARERFGPDAAPAAIILTHGHFDHVGAVHTLLSAWNAPVYAHRLELPYLTGRADYPPPDPTVGRGLMARMAPLFPESGIDITGHVQELPPDGSVPGMPGWRWLSTPGHSPGHISLFRESDRAMLAGDAVTTTNQESAFSVMTQEQELNGPPANFTIDWPASRRSVATLAVLEPLLLATGHGEPMRGRSIAGALADLAHDFDRVALPRRGRYVRQPAVVDATGFVVSVPSVPGRVVRWGALSGAAAAAALAGTWLAKRFRKDRAA